MEQLAEQTGLSKSALGKYETDDYKDISPFAVSYTHLDVYKRQVHCGYSGNPLYVEIQVWDDGAGFDTCLLYTSCWNI